MERKGGMKTGVKGSVHLNHKRKKHFLSYTTRGTGENMFFLCNLGEMTL